METVAFIIFSFSLIALMVGLISPKTVMKFGLPVSRLSVIKYFGSGILIGAILGGIFKENKQEQATYKAVAEPEVLSSDSIHTSLKNDYTVLLKESLKNLDNYYILVSNKNFSKEDVQSIAFHIKNEKCEKACNILLFDEKRAFELYLEDLKGTIKIEDYNYDSEAYKKALEEWKNKNYVYLADHTLGSIDFSTGYFDYYPFKDAEYKRLKKK